MSHHCNIRSQLLSDPDNESVFNLLGKGCFSMATCVVQLFIVQADKNRHKKWVKNCCGVVCFVKDNRKKSYFLRIYDPKRLQMLWEQELYTKFIYNTPKEFFHTFEAHDCHAGLNFASEEEALLFKEIVEEKLLERQNKRLERERKRQAIENAKEVAAMQDDREDVTDGAGQDKSKDNVQHKKDENKKEDDKPLMRKKKKAKKRRPTKDDVGKPIDFRHVSHMSWNADGPHMDKLDPDMKELLAQIGIKEQSKVDKDTMDFIYEFVDKNGGVNAVKEDFVSWKMTANFSNPVDSRTIQSMTEEQPCKKGDKPLSTTSVSQTDHTQVTSGIKVMDISHLKKSLRPIRRPPSPTSKSPNSNRRPPSPPNKPIHINTRPPSPPFKPIHMNKRPPSPPIKPPNINTRPPSPPFKPIDMNKRLPSPPSKPPHINTRPPSPPIKPIHMNKKPPSPPCKPPHINTRPPSPPIKPIHMNKIPLSPPSNPIHMSKRPPSPISKPQDISFKPQSCVLSSTNQTSKSTLSRNENIIHTTGIRSPAHLPANTIPQHKVMPPVDSSSAVSSQDINNTPFALPILSKVTNTLSAPKSTNVSWNNVTNESSEPADSLKLLPSVSGVPNPNFSQPSHTSGLLSSETSVIPTPPPPPPPPPPPSAPSCPVASNQSSPNEEMTRCLKSEINALKESPMASDKDTTDRGVLLRDIRSGTTLRHVDKSEQQSTEKRGSIAAALMTQLIKRKTIIQFSDNEDSSDEFDDDWDD